MILILLVALIQAKAKPFGERQSGNCIQEDGHMQIEGISKARDAKNWTANECLKWCGQQTDVTGCEFRFWSGCIAHSEEIVRGNGRPGFYCWLPQSLKTNELKIGDSKEERRALFFGGRRRRRRSEQRRRRRKWFDRRRRRRVPYDDRRRRRTPPPTAATPPPITTPQCPGEPAGACRIRKKFTSLPQQERVLFMQALKDVRSGNGMATAQDKAAYDAHQILHSTLFSQGIHGTHQFLAWHRWWLWEAENILRRVHPCITIPYWDWEMEAANPWTSNVWQTSTSYYGGNSNGGCVSNGAFQSPWMTAGGQCLRRNFDSNPGIADLIDIQTQVLSVPHSNWNLFRLRMESIHNTPHCAIHGTMCSSRAGESPDFLLHHNNIDRIWATWQAISSSHLTAQSSTGVQYTQPMRNAANTQNTAAGYTPQSFTYNSALPGNTCVQYDALLATNGRRKLETADKTLSSVTTNVLLQTADKTLSSVTTNVLLQTADKTLSSVTKGVLSLLQEQPVEKLRQLTHFQPFNVELTLEFYKVVHPEKSEADVRAHFEQSGLFEWAENRKDIGGLSNKITGRNRSTEQIFAVLTGVTMSSAREVFSDDPTVIAALSIAGNAIYQISNGRCDNELAKANEMLKKCPAPSSCVCSEFARLQPSGCLFEYGTATTSRESEASGPDRCCRDPCQTN